MSIKVVLFDLDGTLLPMDQSVFMKRYFGALARRLARRGYEPEKLISAIWQGTAKMVANDGSATNEDVFWQEFCRIFGERARDDMPEFEAFYREEFPSVSDACGHDPAAAPAVRAIRDMGYRVGLATNPLFPSMATECRMSWAGLSPADFEVFTTYENSGFCKPNPAYYLDVARRMGAEPSECLMVGNDVAEDMVAAATGMQVFLLTDCLINKENKDIDQYPHGSFPELLEFVRAL